MKADTPAFVLLVIATLVLIFLVLLVLLVILRKEDRIFMEIDDLKQSVADLTAADGALAKSITAAITELLTAEQQLTDLKAKQTIVPADVEAAAQSVKNVTAHLAAAKDALDAAAPPAPAPAAA